MVGLGETRELQEAFEALRENDVDILTIGRYLRPSLQHLPLERCYHPDEFVEMKTANSRSARHVESAPLVRSSYHAQDQVLRTPNSSGSGARPRSTRRAGSSRLRAEIEHSEPRTGDLRPFAMPLTMPRLRLTTVMAPALAIAALPRASPAGRRRHPSGQPRRQRRNRRPAERQRPPRRRRSRRPCRRRRAAAISTAYRRLASASAPMTAGASWRR